MVAVRVKCGGTKRRKRPLAVTSTGIQYRPRYFQGNRDPESNFFKVEGGVTHRGVTLPTSQHHIVLRKALLFGDHEAEQKVKATPHATEAKKIGLRVRSVDKELWERKCVRIMQEIVYDKFSRNEDLRSYLVKVRGDLFEAKSKDSFWGIGITQRQAVKGVPPNGANQMGKILAHVRSRLLLEQSLVNM